MNTSCFSLETPVWCFDICVYYETIKSNYLVTSHIYFLWEHWQPPLGIFKHAAQLSGQPESGWYMMELQKQIILAEYLCLLGIVFFPFSNHLYFYMVNSCIHCSYEHSFFGFYVFVRLSVLIFLHLFNFMYNSDF